MAELPPPPMPSALADCLTTFQSAAGVVSPPSPSALLRSLDGKMRVDLGATRSEEHTSELQPLRHLVCRLLLEKKRFRPAASVVKGRAVVRGRAVLVAERPDWMRRIHNFLYFFLMIRRPPRSTLFPLTALFRS